MFTRVMSAVGWRLLPGVQTGAILFERCGRLLGQEVLMKSDEVFDPVFFVLFS